jgi:adenylate kinase
MNIVLLGAPGSGKGTQAERLRDKLKLTHVATGDLFRHHLKRETELGLLAREYMNRGELVPDQITIDMLRQRLNSEDVASGIILDGFPRTLGQAEALGELMAEIGKKIDCVMCIEVPDEELVARLSGRWICRECQVPFHKIFNPFQKCPENRCQGEHLYQREDDQPEVVRARLKTYHSLTEPLIQYYRDARILICVDGLGSVQEVTGACLAALAHLKD